MADLWREVRYSLRALRKAPTFSIAAILTLAFAVAANAVTFALLKTVVINPLPYSDPNHLVAIVEADPHAPYPETISAATFAEVRRTSRSFAALSLWGDWSIRPTDAAPGDMIRGMRVSASFFDTLGVPMFLGRGFDADEERATGSHVVVLTYPTWRDRFGADPHIIGRSIPTLDGGYVVIGVAPADFVPLHMSNPAEQPRVFTPLGFEVDAASCRSPTCRGFRAIGRLRSDVSIKQANADLVTVAQRLQRVYPNDYPAGAAITAASLWEQIVGRFASVLWMVQAAAVLLLLLACANVATLLTVRLTARNAELAIRASLGASHIRLVRGLSVEHGLIASVAAVVGTSLAWTTTRLIGRIAEPNLPRIAQLRPDASMLGVAVGASFLTMAAFGVIPAVAVSRRIAATSRIGNNSTRSTTDALRLRTLLSAEMAVAFVLVAIVSLLSRSYANLTRIDPGYEPKDVLTLSLLPSMAANHVAYFDAVAARVRQVPGVDDAAYASTLPLSHPATALLFIRERPSLNDADAPNLNAYLVSPNYCSVLRIPLVRGRSFTPADSEAAARVALISESAARAYFGETDPVGQHVKLQRRDETHPWATIVGIVKDVHQYGLDANPDAAVYVPFSQVPLQGWASLVVRSKLPVDRIEASVRAAMLAVDPQQPVFHVQPMSEYLALSMAQRTFALALVTVVGAIALALGLAGVFGISTYIVQQRRRELAVRLALGAVPSHLVLRTIGEVSTLVAIGIGVGAATLMLSSQAVSGLLFGVSALDVPTHVTTGILLALAGVAASAPATWRIVQMDPATALRSE